MLPWRWDLLFDALVWSCLIEVGDVGLEHTAQVLLANNHEMIQAFAAYAPQQSLAHRICPGCFDWRSQLLDSSADRDGSKV